MSDTSPQPRLEPAPRRDVAADAAESPPRLDPVDQLWRLFSSTKLALGLILAIAILSLFSVLLVQAPAGLGSEDFAVWLQRVRPRYGALTDVLAGLQLFAVANSLWMRLLLGALAVNTLVCTLNRWPRLWRATFQPTVRAGEAIFQSASFRDELTLGRGAGVGALRAALSRHGYRTLVEEGPTSTYLYADQHRFGRLGTLLTHLAIILFLVGGVVTSVFGLRNSEFTVPEGSTRPVGFGTQLAVKAEAFVDEYYPDGPPKDYRSDLVLFEGGREVARQTIRVNEPLIYQGIRFHQSFFGPSVVLEVRDAAGAVVFEDGVALAYRMGERPLGFFDIPEQRLTGYVIAPASGRSDPGLPAGQVRLELLKDGRQLAGGSEVLTLGQPKVIGGLSYTFVRERQFTGLQVVRDPGSWVIWAASALMVVGMVAVFYFPHRRVWARLRARPDGQLQAQLAGVASRDPRFVTQLRQVVDELRGRSTSPPIPLSATAERGRR